MTGCVEIIAGVMSDLSFFHNILTS